MADCADPSLVLTKVEDGKLIYENSIGHPEYVRNMISCNLYKFWQIYEYQHNILFCSKVILSFNKDVISE